MKRNSHDEDITASKTRVSKRAEIVRIVNSTYLPQAAAVQFSRPLPAIPVILDNSLLFAPHCRTSAGVTWRNMMKEPVFVYTAFLFRYAPDNYGSLLRPKSIVVN